MYICAHTQHACHWGFFSTSLFFYLGVFWRCKKICYQNSNSANGSANDFRNLVKIVYGLFKPTAHADCFVFFLVCVWRRWWKKKKRKLTKFWATSNWNFNFTYACVVVVTPAVCYAVTQNKIIAHAHTFTYRFSLFFLEKYRICFSLGLCYIRCEFTSTKLHLFYC